MIGEGISRLQAGGLDRIVDADVRAMVAAVEVEARRLASVQVELLAAVDYRALYSIDGHANAKVMVRHLCRLSPAHAASRMRIVKAVRDLPALEAAWAQGGIGIDQMALVGRVHANPRVRAALPAFQDDLITLARRCSFPDFELAIRRWEQLADADGPEPRNTVNHHNRDVRLTQDSFDLSWRLHGQFGALQGAHLHELLDHFTQLEWQRDWAEARDKLGDNATIADLARTDAQRRADALEHLSRRAAGTPPGGSEPEVVHHVVWDADTYFATLHRLDCTDPACSAVGHGRPNQWYNPATYRCETLDGVPLEPVEAAVASLADRVRRVLINSKGVVIDLGRKTRLFTGSARLAVKLQHPTCIWPGCRVPTTACEADHLHPHGQGGPTNPDNGAPLCGRHNRWKQKGFTTWKDPTGAWHTQRPDGSEIP